MPAAVATMFCSAMPMLKKSLGVSLAEYCALGRAREVCVEHDYVFVRFAQLGKHRTVNFSYLLRH